MKKIAFTFSLLLAGRAFAQEPAPAVPTTPAPVTPTDSTTPVPLEPPAGSVPAVPEESFDPALLGGGGGEGTLSAEELEKLGFGGGSPAVDTNLKIFGFADVNFSLLPVSKDNQWRQALQPHSQFFVGNFNLYVSKSLSENVRMMGEVRFHYAPHGSSDAAGMAIVNQADDVADFNRPVHLGSIEIERMYLEWSMFPWLSVRLGQFLTPYGIWNVDHGSPVYIPPTRPYVIGSALFPERQTGAEFLGRSDLSTDNTIGYHFTLSNGMGPVVEVRDLDENKGVGGRVFWENRSLGTLRVGGSAFYAKDTTSYSASGLDAAGALHFTEVIQAQSKVLSLAADVQWRYRGWHLQAELITQQRKYVDGGRQAATNPFTGQPIFPIDYTSWGAYGLVGYGFDVPHGINLMPYFLVSSFDQLTTTFFRTKTNGFTVGFNVRPIDALVIKLAYSLAAWPDGSLISDQPLHLIQSQVAWAF